MSGSESFEGGSPWVNYGGENSFSVYGGEDSGQNIIIGLFALAIIAAIIVIISGSSGTLGTTGTGTTGTGTTGTGTTGTGTTGTGTTGTGTTGTGTTGTGTTGTTGTITWSRTPLYGGEGGNPFEFKCPEDRFIQRLNYRAGSGVDQVSADCGNNIVSNLYGGPGGNPGNWSHPDGVNSYLVTTGEYVGNITPGTYSSAQPTGGTASDIWSGTEKKLTCPSGKIAGIYGRYGDWLDSIGFYCKSLN